MSKQAIGLESLQELITRGPFNRWLNFTFLRADEEGIEVEVGWREEWVVNPDRRYTHGGILAAIVDTAADYAIAANLGRPVPTISVRVTMTDRVGDSSARYRGTTKGNVSRGTPTNTN